MKKLMLLSLALGTLLLISCNNDDEFTEQITTNINLNIKASYEAEPLQMQQEYNLCDGRLIKFTQFNFFVSDIVLLTESDPEAPVTDLKEVDFVDLTFSDEASAMQGHVIEIQNAPVGTYSGIRLGLGVAADLNRTKPAEYGSNSPLSKNSHYWDGWSSYIFAKMDGFADLNNDGEIMQGGGDSEGVTFHMGSDDVYATAQIIQDIVLIEESDGSITLNIDLSTAFETLDPVYSNGNGCHNIEDYNGTHTDAELSIAKKMLSNLANSITIEL